MIDHGDLAVKDGRGDLAAVDPREEDRPVVALERQTAGVAGAAPRKGLPSNKSDCPWRRRVMQKILAGSPRRCFLRPPRC
jgi:hypothetical protein